MNWEFIFFEILKKFGTCALIIIAFVFNRYYVTVSREKDLHKAENYEKIIFYIIAIGSSAFCSRVISRSFTNSSFYVWLIVLGIPAIYGVIYGLKLDNKLTDNERLKRINENK